MREIEKHESNNKYEALRRLKKQDLQSTCWVGERDFPIFFIHDIQQHEYHSPGDLDVWMSRAGS